MDFVCSVQYSQGYPVLWIKVNKNKEDQLPISTNTALIIRDSRFSLRSDSSSSTYTLQVKIKCLWSKSVLIFVVFNNGSYESIS